MFIHLLAGSLIFLLLGEIFGFKIDRMYLFLGAFCGLAPDLISYLLSWEVKLNKWAHRHRDNFSHSVFFPIMVLIVAFLFNSNLAIIMGAAMLTHPFLDLFGIGWGVKLFYPLSNKTYKLFYKRRILTIWDQKEADAEAEKFGDDNWVKNIYFKPNIIGSLEWLSLAGFLLLVIIN